MLYKVSELVYEISYQEDISFIQLNMISYLVYQISYFVCQISMLI